MKKILICFVAVFSLFLFDSQKTEAAQLEGAKPISEVFPDPIFAQYIADLFSIDVEDSVTQVDLDKVRHVVFSNSDLESIEGFQYLNGTWSIQLVGTKVSDLTPFASWEPFTNRVGQPTYDVSDINLASSPITDLTPLINLKLRLRFLALVDIPIDNSQTDNLVTLSTNLDPTICGLSFNQIDDFSRLGETVFGDPEKNINQGYSKHQTINLGEVTVMDDDPLTVQNPSLGYDGRTVPILFDSISSSGVKSEDNTAVTWHNLSETKPDKVYFTAEINEGLVSEVIPATTRIKYLLDVKYEATRSNVTVNYVDEQGEPIVEPLVLTGNYKDTYTTEAKEVAGYTPKGVPDNATGTFSKEDQEVTYVYTKDIVLGEAVTVYYVDQQGENLQDPLVLTGNLDEKYQTEAQKFTGYTLLATPGNAAGVFTNEAQTVIYTYQKDSAAEGQVVVKYVDEKDENLLEPIKLTGIIGADYLSEAKEIDGYELIETPANAQGQYGEELIEVRYVYRKLADQKATPTATKTDEDSTQMKQAIKAKGTSQPTATNLAAKKSAAKTFPQTGEKSTTSLGIFSGIIVIAGAVFIFKRLKS